MHQAASTPLSAALVKVYKTTLLKLQFTQLGGEESTAVDALGQKRLTALAISRRLRSDINVHRGIMGVAFANLHRHLLELDLRGLWAASKQGAKERLRSLSAGSSPQALPTPVQQPQAAAASSSKLREILGQDGYLRTSLIYILATASRTFMHSLNSSEVHGAQVMQRALQRPSGQALITVCNHVAAMDDPLVLATVVPQQYYNQPENIRWTLCASDRCFKYAGLSALFTAAKVLPIERGGGMQQPGMQAAEDRLRHGDWVHIFPEGTRSQGGGKMGAVRKGIGKLVAACEQPPLLVPFVHSGMEEVMPRGKVLPKLGKTVRVLVGEPIPVQDLLLKAQRQQWSEDQLHSAIASRVSTHLHTLKARLDAAQPGEAPLSSVVELAAAADLEPVSSLDLYDEADVRWHHRATVWEKLQFRMQHRRWLLEGAGPMRLAQQQAGAAGRGGHAAGVLSMAAAAAVEQGAAEAEQGMPRPQGIAAAITAAACAPSGSRAPNSSSSSSSSGSSSGSSVWATLLSLAARAEGSSLGLPGSTAPGPEGAMGPGLPGSATLWGKGESAGLGAGGALGLYARHRVDRMVELLQHAAQPSSPIPLLSHAAQR